MKLEDWLLIDTSMGRTVWFGTMGILSIYMWSKTGSCVNYHLAGPARFDFIETGEILMCMKYLTACIGYCAKGWWAVGNWVMGNEESFGDGPIPTCSPKSHPLNTSSFGQSGHGLVQPSITCHFLIVLHVLISKINFHICNFQT